MAALGAGFILDPLPTSPSNNSYGTSYSIKYYNCGTGFILDPLPTSPSNNSYGTSYSIKYYNCGTGFIFIFPLVPAGNDPTRYGRG